MSGDPSAIVEWAKGIGQPIALLGLGWWLSGRFRNLELAGEDRLEKMKEAFRTAISAHEALDQMRHEQNLSKFTDIKVILARAGLNGLHKESGNN